MSETTKSDVLAAIVGMEAAAFRTGLAARRLLAEHPDLPVKGISPGYLGGGNLELQINADYCDGVRAWAERLGLQAETTTSSYTVVSGYENVYEACHASGQVDGVNLEFLGTRSLDGAERDAWIAERDQAAVGEPVSGGAV